MRLTRRQAYAVHVAARFVFESMKYKSWQPSWRYVEHAVRSALRRFDQGMARRALASHRRMTGVSL